MAGMKSRNITPEEHWQITCHEAGHAIVAVRRGITFQHVIRGDGEHGEVELAVNPIDDPEGDFDAVRLSHYQEFYAGGAAAERLMFGTDRAYALRCDEDCHEKLERRLGRCRNQGFEEDIQSALKILDHCSVEKVAKELADKGKLNMEQVAALTGCRLPWE
jgi:hypothetical protein